MKYNENGTYKDIYVKSLDTLPVGTEVDFDGNEVPSGWTEIPDPNTYSTDEVRVGTWIDGKSLYRKVYNFGALPNATTKSVALNINNLNEVISIRGITKNTTGDFTTTVPQVDASNLSSQLQVYVQSGNLSVYTTSNKSNYDKTYIILEYTKTTD